MDITGPRYDVFRQELPAVGRCIYCPRTDNLTIEHTFPKSLAGRTELPDASCPGCADITKRFEQTCARGMFGPLRLVFDFPGSAKKDRPKQLPLITKTADGSEAVLQVPISDYPATPVLFPIFDLPGMLLDLPPQPGFRGSSIKLGNPFVADNEDRLRRIEERAGMPIDIVVPTNTDMLAFSRLLAKIAHSSAVGRFGYDAFSHLLPPYILGQSDYLSHVVGCMAEQPFLSGPEHAQGTHKIFYTLASYNRLAADGSQHRTELLAGIVLLFKDLKPPPYLVLIGEPTPALAAQLGSGRQPIPLE